MFHKSVRNIKERIYARRNRLLWDENLFSFDSYDDEDDLENEFEKVEERKKERKLFGSTTGEVKVVPRTNSEDDHYVEITSANGRIVEYKKESEREEEQLLAKTIVKERKEWIRDNCRQIINANKMIDEAVVEYKVVCSYINDVQKIELVEKSEKKRLIETAKKMQKLTEENEKFKKRKQARIKASQFATIKSNEDIMVDEIMKLENYEKDCSIVKADLDKLEGERGNLNYERESLISYQKFLKFFSKFVAASLSVIYLVIGMIYFSIQIDMSFPLIIATMVAIASTLYIVLVSRSNAYKLEINEKKMNKLIMLFNKVKIKYFNSYNLVDYVRSKYNVKNSKELKFIWDKYIQEKEILNKHTKNVELYEVYENSLVRELNRLKVEDADIWTSQVSAITNPEEMKEIRERLDVRRQSLKSRIDYNNKFLEDGKSNIRDIITTRKDYKEEVINILRTYNINI